MSRKKTEKKIKYLSYKDTALAYEIVRSSRKTMAVQIKPDGSVYVRIPYRVTDRAAEKLAESNKEWIFKHHQEARTSGNTKREYSEDEVTKGRRVAGQEIRKKAALYGALMGVDFGRITIRRQKTRWGSCSAGGNLSFNWKLILMPERILDYVVIHELAHRLEMNHSRDFWAVVERAMPDYRDCRGWLREHGREYI